MPWQNVPYGRVVDELSRLHVEAVINGVRRIIETQDVTVDELKKVLELIEDEAIGIERLNRKKESNGVHGS